MTPSATPVSMRYSHIYILLFLLFLLLPPPPSSASPLAVTKLVHMASCHSVKVSCHACASIMSRIYVKASCHSCACIMARIHEYMDILIQGQ